MDQIGVRAGREPFAVALPIFGRIADPIGVRETARIGLLTMPVIYFAYSMMTGPISQYSAIYLSQGFPGVATTTTVYGRLLIQHIQKARPRPRELADLQHHDDR